MSCCPPIRHLARAALIAAALVPAVLYGQSGSQVLALGAPSGAVVNVSTEKELQTAVRRLAPNTTIVLAPGTYRLTKTLAIAGPLSNVALRGATENADDVVLQGNGMSSANTAGAADGVATQGAVSGLTIANLTMRDFSAHAVVYNAGAQRPLVHNLHLVDVGGQFIKSNPDGAGGGVNDGVIEYSVIEYSTTGKSANLKGVEIQSGANWAIRHNLFRNIVAPASELAGPALLVWKSSSNTLTEGNRFLNCSTAIAYGQVDGADRDHRGGIIRNNIVYRSAAQAGGVGISAANSPDTRVLNNTVYLSGTYATPIEYRFAGSTGVALTNNLVDGFIWARDGATGAELNNLGGATDGMFVNAPAGDLHLAAAATSAIDHGIDVADVIDDWDGQPRPTGSADIGADEYWTLEMSNALSKSATTTTSALSAAPMAAAAAAAPTAITIDAVVSADSTASASTITTGAFSTTATNELLLALVAADGGTTANTVTGVTGAGLTWQLVKRTNTQLGTSEIWRAFATATLSAATVKATFSQAAPASITVVSLSGVDPSGTNGSGAIGATASGSANPGAPTATLSTTRANSWVFGVGNDWDKSTARTIGPNQTMIHEHRSSAHAFWVQRTTSPTPSSGTSVTLNDTAPTADRFNMTIVEVLRAPTTDTTAPTAAISAPASGATVSGTGVTITATAADNVGVVGVQFKVDGANLGPEDTTSPYSQVWNTTTIANGTHTLTAVARDAAGNTTTSAAVTVTVANAVADTIRPTVSLTAPASGSTVSGSAVTVAATATDNVGVVGVQFQLDGVNLGAEDTSAPYSTAWNTTAAANGTHTLTAIARDAAGNTTTSTTTTVTVSNSTIAAPVIDAVVSADSTASASTISTGAFSTTAANELLLAFVAADGGTTANTVTGVSGAGLTWQLVKRTNTQLGTSEIWRAFATTTLSAVSATATFSQAAPASITVVSLSGVDGSGTNGSGAIGATASGSANPGAPTATLSTTRANSWVFGVGNDWDRSTARTIGPNQTMIHEHAASAHAFWVQRATSPTAASGTSVTLNDTAPTADRFNMTIVEVLRAATADTTAPTVAISAPAAGATVSGTSVTIAATAADNVGVVGVQFKVDGVNVGAEDTASAYSQVWNTTGVANGTHTLTAVARDAAGNTTTSAAVTVMVSNAVADTTWPTVSLTAPSSGSTVSGSAVTVAATASDNVGVVGVQFKLDGVNLGAEDTSAPYSTTWNTTAVANGTHTLTAIVRDAFGNTTTSAVTTVTVSNASAAPTAVIFKASVDQATVTSYLLEIFANGADPNTATAIASSDLGKGTPDANGDITVNRASFFAALAPGTYLATISSLGPGGPARSAAVTFTR